MDSWPQEAWLEQKKLFCKEEKHWIGGSSRVFSWLSHFIVFKNLFASMLNMLFDNSWPLSPLYFDAKPVKSFGAVQDDYKISKLKTSTHKSIRSPQAEGKNHDQKWNQHLGVSSPRAVSPSKAFWRTRWGFEIWGNGQWHGGLRLERLVCGLGGGLFCEEQRRLIMNYGTFWNISLPFKDFVACYCGRHVFSPHFLLKEEEVARSS